MRVIGEGIDGGRGCLPDCIPSVRGREGHLVIQEYHSGGSL